jgi:trans-aconitate methyltransferase
MVLKEFADSVKGFERERHLVEIARSLLPDIEFECVESLTRIEDKEPYDLVMTCTVLQHLTDADAREICGVMKRLAPEGYILCIEKTEAINTTANTEDGTQFISRARSVHAYQDLIQPYELVVVRDRVVEPTYSNPRPGTCMVFTSPRARLR